MHRNIDSNQITRSSRLVLRRLTALVALSLLPACSKADDPTSAGSPVPSALNGHWRLTAATGSQTCDPTGHCTGAYGGSESYAFGADGHFEFTQYLETN